MHNIHTDRIHCLSQQVLDGFPVGIIGQASNTHAIIRTTNTWPYWSRITSSITLSCPIIATSSRLARTDLGLDFLLEDSFAVHLTNGGAGLIFARELDKGEAWRSARYPYFVDFAETIEFALQILLCN
jgi:hypothetical protein